MAQTPVTSYKKPGQGTPNSANNNAQGNAAPHPQVADHPPTTLSSLLFTEETDERVLAMLFNQPPGFGEVRAVPVPGGMTLHWPNVEMADTLALPGCRART